MKKRMKPNARIAPFSRPTLAVGCIGQLDTASVRVPTVAVMTPNEAKTFSSKGIQVQTVGVARPGIMVPRIVLPQLRDQKRVNFVVGGLHAACSERHLTRLKASFEGVQMTLGQLIVPVKQKKVFAQYKKARAGYFHASKRASGCKGIEVEVEEGPQGMPVIVIISPPGVTPTYMVKHKVKSEKDSDKGGKEPPGGGGGGNTFLKKEYKDRQMIDALIESSRQEFGGGHEGTIRYHVGVNNDKVKKYSDIHLLICLFFYIHLNKLYLSDSFYNGQRGRFVAYCRNELEKSGYKFCSSSYFSRAVNELVYYNGGFEEYIKADKKPEINLLSGNQDFVFWYEIYRRVSVCFSKAIAKEQSK